MIILVCKSSLLQLDKLRIVGFHPPHHGRTSRFAYYGSSTGSMLYHHTTERNNTNERRLRTNYSFPALGGGLLGHAWWSLFVKVQYRSTVAWMIPAYGLGVPSQRQACPTMPNCMVGNLRYTYLDRGKILLTVGLRRARDILKTKIK